MINAQSFQWFALSVRKKGFQGKRSDEYWHLQNEQNNLSVEFIMYVWLICIYIYLRCILISTMTVQKWLFRAPFKTLVVHSRYPFFSCFVQHYVIWIGLLDTMDVGFSTSVRVWRVFNLSRSILREIIKYDVELSVVF